MFRNLLSMLLILIIFDKYVQPTQYRSDYVYNKKTDAFYKFHIETLPFRQAKMICENEGAEIIVLTSEYDIIQVHAMFKHYPDIDSYAWVETDGKVHDSAELKPIINMDDFKTSHSEEELKDEKCDVITRDGTIEGCYCYRPLPFVCKVEAENAFYDAHCMVYGKDYQYFESVESCYKLQKIPYTWNQAYAECQSQGAHLVVLNSDGEHKVIKNEIWSKVTDIFATVYNPKTSWFFNAGIRAQIVAKGYPIVFKTIFNQTLDEAGYSRWSPNEPNNSLGIENCGTIFKNDGNYNDVDCSDFYAFICEKEIQKL